MATIGTEERDTVVLEGPTDSQESLTLTTPDAGLRKKLALINSAWGQLVQAVVFLAVLIYVLIRLLLALPT